MLAAKASAEGGSPTIVQFMDRVTGTAVYINPVYVVTVRPEPTDPGRSWAPLHRTACYRRR